MLGLFLGTALGNWVRVNDLLNNQVLFGSQATPVAQRSELLSALINGLSAYDAGNVQRHRRAREILCQRAANFWAASLLEGLDLLYWEQAPLSLQRFHFGLGQRWRSRRMDCGNK